MEDNFFENNTKKYKICYADFDTAIFSTSLLTEDKFVRVTHLPTGKSKVFDKVSDWRGMSLKNPSAKWKALYDKVPEESKHLYEIDQFEETPFSQVKTPQDPTKSIVEEVCSRFDYFVGVIRKHSNAEDYRLLVGGNGINPRYDWAEILPYKGTRPPKPELFDEVKAYILKKYKNKIILADNREADDLFAEYAWNNYQNYLKTGKWENCFAFIDKDLKMLPQHDSFDYTNVESGHFSVTYSEGIQHLCYQLLLGDKVDNIQGLPSISNELKEEYKLRKGRGLGEKAASRIALVGCHKESLLNVIDCYIDHYGVYEFTFENHKGESYPRYWSDMLEENLKLLWMYRDDSMEYSFNKLLVEVFGENEDYSDEV